MGLLDGLKKAITGGVNNNLDDYISSENDRAMKIYQQNVEKINALEAAYENLTNEELTGKTEEFRRRLKNGESLDKLLVEAFAVAREASWRVLEMRHFDVQLIGGMALHEGRLAEMATGEGKTLVAVLPLYLNALAGDGTMIVTTSDYLARRDGEMMGQVFRFLGLSVGIIQSYQKEEERKQAYHADITYISNQELGFDYLRDNLALSISNVVQTRPYNFCIVDEADSILIDEARTPLIISRLGQASTDKYYTSADIVKKYLKKGQHYEVSVKDQRVDLTSEGYNYCQQIIGKDLYDLKDPWAFYLLNAIKAVELFQNDREYVIVPPVEGKEDYGPQIAIVDSFTGRVLEGRRFTDGIQQAIEAKEGLKISGETQVIAKVTYQSLFKLFPKLSGMTGTASTDLQEFYEVYELKTITIPTALPVARRDNPDAIFRTKNGKMKALLRNILSTHSKGRPILIGTTSVEYSEEIYQALQDLEINNVKLLNARPENIEKEADIVAQAGRLRSVTVATNMAGRGTDIILGGSAKGLIKGIVKQYLLVQLGLSELTSTSSNAVATDDDENDEKVVITEEAEVKSEFQAALINDKVDDDATTEQSDEEAVAEEDEQVEGEDDPDLLALPSMQAIMNSLDLSLPKSMKKSTEIRLKQAIISVLDSWEEIPSTKIDKIMVEDIIARAVESTPTTNPVIRLLRQSMTTAINELDQNLRMEREVVKKLGGLYVIGTSRHESRRIDQQLRGRAGRQGDPGGTRFFLSLEDDIFKIFGADKLTGIMESFRVAEDMPLESDLVVQALNKVQTSVEDNYRGIRKQLYRLDEVTATQRSVIYSQRRAYLTSSDQGLIETFTKYCQLTMKEIFDASFSAPAGSSSSSSSSKTKNSNNIDHEKLFKKVLQFFPNIQLSIDELQSTPSVSYSEVLSPLFLSIVRSAD
jgi:preprotein translocase subunit SecA